MRRLLPLLAALSIAALIAITAAAPPQPATAQSVTIVDFAFQPPTRTIAPGDTVTWTNDGPSDHTTTSDTALWDSGTVTATSTFTVTFTQTGSFPYHCAIHSGMTGTIVVAEPTAMPTNTGTSTPSHTPSPTPTRTATNTPTNTPTRTNTPTQTHMPIRPTPPTASASRTATPGMREAFMPIVANPPTPTFTPSPTATPTNTPLPTATPIPPPLSGLVIQLADMPIGFTVEEFRELTNAEAAKSYPDPAAALKAFAEQGRETSWFVRFYSDDYILAHEYSVN